MTEKNKNFLIPVVSAVAGGLVVFAALKVTPTRSAGPTRAVWNQDSLDLDPFFSLSKSFMKQASAFEGFRGVNDLEQREDDEFVYIDLKLDDPHDTSVSTKIEDGYLTIMGTVEKKSEEQNHESMFKSSFNRTLPLPENIDEHKMQMSSEKDKIILRFPKIKA